MLSEGIKMISEKEFGKKFVKLLHRYGFETWHEVQPHEFGPVIDIVAKYKKIVITFELKTSLNDTVLEQAFRGKAYSHYSFAVIPKRKKM